MDPTANVKVNISIADSHDLHLLDDVLAKLAQRGEEVAIYLDNAQPDLQTQINEWIASVYSNPAQ